MDDCVALGLKGVEGQRGPPGSSGGGRQEPADRSWSAQCPRPRQNDTQYR